MHNLTFFFVFLLILSSCEQQNQQQTIDTQMDESVMPTEKQSSPRQQFIVQAKSGLNFRDTPKGKVMGKFEQGTKLNLHSHTDVFEEIMDEGKALYGEWLGVQLGDTTVFVFDAFLIPVLNPTNNPSTSTHEKSSVTTFSPYIIEAYHYKDQPNFAYVPMPWSSSPESPLIDSAYLGYGEFEEYHYLKGTNRSSFLSKQKLQEDDRMFIYNYQTDRIYSYQLKELPLLAHINVYGAKGAVTEWEYVIGFTLEKKWKKFDYKDLSNCFVYFGAQNPFASGQLKPMVWDKIESESFPKLEIDTAAASRLAKIQIDSISTFTCKIDEISYYLNCYHMNSYSFAGAVHMIAQSTDTVLLNKVYFESEGTTFSGLILKGQPERDYAIQWTGKLFQHGPPVMFGFFDTAFGCPWITLLDGSNKDIGIACDNRH